MARSPRRKAPAQPAPATREQALELLREYRAIDEVIASAVADYEQAVEDARQLRDAIAEELKPRLAEIFAQLRAWWAVAGQAETGGRRKSVELGGLVIGERTTPPALKLPRGLNEASAIDAILDLPVEGAAELVVVTRRLDRPSILARVRGDEADRLGALLRGLGFAASQREEFFIDRPPPRAAQVEAVPLAPIEPTGGVA